MEKALHAIKDGLIDGGMKIVTGFPGYKAHDLFALCGGTQISVNEKVAYETAWGASFAGLRSAVMFKNVGMNAAADPFINSMLLGINAGLVVIVVDDTIHGSSQSNQDSRSYSTFFGGLWLEPYSLQSAYDLAYQSFEYGEKTGMPVVIRITSDLLMLEGKYKKSKAKQVPRKPPPKEKRLVAYPTFSKELRTKHEKNIKSVQTLVDSLYVEDNFVIKQNKETILRFGATKEVPKQKYTQIFTYPLPQKIKSIVTPRITVLETGGTFARDRVAIMRGLLGVTSQITPFLPKPAPSYQKVAPHYKKLFTSLEHYKPHFLSLDLGMFTHTTVSCPQSALCFGASEGVALGATLAGLKKILCVTGDTTFMHSGKDVLPEILKRNQDVSIVLLKNGIAESSGGQVSPGDLSIPEGFKVYKIIYKNVSALELAGIYKQMETDGVPSILLLSL